MPNLVLTCFSFCPHFESGQTCMSCSSPWHFPDSEDSCVITVPPVTTVSSFMSRSFTKYQTKMVVLFLNTCQYIGFNSTPWGWVMVVVGGVGGGCTTIHNEELLTIFVLVWCLFTLLEEVGEGRGGWVPFLKFTWTSVQTAWRGRATFKEWVTPPPPTPTKADLVIAGYETWPVKLYVQPPSSTTVLLHRQLQYTTIGDFCWQCIFISSLQCVEFCAESSYTKHCIHLQTYCIVLSRLSKSFQSLNRYWKTRLPALMLSTVNWVWKNNMEDSSKAQEEDQYRLLWLSHSSACVHMCTVSLSAIADADYSLLLTVYLHISTLQSNINGSFIQVCTRHTVFWDSGGILFLCKGA